MSVEAIDAGGIFRVGGVLRRAWRLFAGDILFFLAVPVLIYATDLIASGYVSGVLANAMPGVSLPTQTGWMLAAGGFLFVLLPLGLNMLGQAVLVLGAVQRLRGQPLRLGEVLRKALARVIPLVGLVLLWSLALGLCLVAGALLLSFTLWGVIGEEWPSLSSSPPAVVSLPLLFLASLFLASLVPTAMLLVVSAVVVPACVVERLGPLASMVRSVALTKRDRWKIFGIMLLLAVVTAGGQIIDELVAPDDWGLAILVDAVWSVPLIAYWNATVIMTYHDLRVAKEGAGTGQIAVIFD